VILEALIAASLANVANVAGVAAPVDAPGAGLYFEQTTVVVPQGQAPGAGVKSRVWHSTRRMRLEAGDAAGGPALLLRLDEGRALRLDPETKVAYEIDPAGLRARSHQDASVVATLIGGADALRTAPLDGQRTIAGHACRGYRLKSRSASVELWVAADLPSGASVFADFLEWSGAAQALPGLVGAIRELPGFPLETRTRVSVLGETQETLSTVTKIRIGPQPDALFEVPSGWRVQPSSPPNDGGPNR
jgi:hypothetical protein